MNPRRGLREALAVFALAFGACAVLGLLAPSWSFLHDNLLGFVGLVFLYLPLLALRRAGREPADYALTSAGWRAGARTGLLVMLVVAPLFALGYHGWHGLVQGVEPLFALTRLRHPEEGHLWWLLFVAVQFVVVALPEEVLFRGYLQGRLDEVWAPRWRVLGATLGPGWLLATLLFALGHLAIEPSPYRLLVFFPGLLFGWLRARSGGLAAPIVAHALSNVLIRVLASFYYTQGLL